MWPISITPSLAPTPTQAVKPGCQDICDLMRTLDVHCLLLDQRKPPVSGFGFSHCGDLRGRGRQTSLAFVKLDLGARDVNADGPSHPWMHPGAGKILSERECCYFVNPGCL